MEQQWLKPSSQTCGWAQLRFQLPRGKFFPSPFPLLTCAVLLGEQITHYHQESCFHFTLWTPDQSAQGILIIS
jgi:hypothetical protein